VLHALEIRAIRNRTAPVPIDQKARRRRGLRLSGSGFEQRHGPKVHALRSSPGVSACRGDALRFIGGDALVTNPLARYDGAMLGVAVAAVVAPFLAAVILTFVVRAWSLRTGFVDRPGGHKQHGRVVALGGGIAIFLGVFAPVLGGALGLRALAGTSLMESLPATLTVHLGGIAARTGSLMGITLAALVLHITGLIDDRRPLGPWTKLAVQIGVAGFTAIVLRVRLLEGPLPSWASIVATLVWIVVITNAFNFLDNMDGLSAGVAAIASLMFAIAALGAGQLFVPILALALSGALVGFLVFNFHPASIFMGDAGSLVVGYTLSVLTILTTFYDPAFGLTPLGLAVPLLVLAVPLYDVLSVVIHRVRSGDSPFRGDRRHFSHRLLRKGLTVRGAVLTIYLATAATGLPAVVMPHVEWRFAALLVAQCA
ncbi:MAG: MraY family glycosyltransferase, partial [Anaerolineae bacterium]